jgi:hypothetical protein
MVFTADHVKPLHVSHISSNAKAKTGQHHPVPCPGPYPSRAVPKKGPWPSHAWVPGSPCHPEPSQRYENCRPPNCPFFRLFAFLILTLCAGGVFPHQFTGSLNRKVYGEVGGGGEKGDREKRKDGTSEEMKRGKDRLGNGERGLGYYKRNEKRKGRKRKAEEDDRESMKKVQNARKGGGDSGKEEE